MDSQNQRSVSWDELVVIAASIPDDQAPPAPDTNQSLELQEGFFDEPDQTLPPKALAQTFRALANELRLEIIEALLAGHGRAVDLSRELEVSPSKLSHHLHILEYAGIVQIEDYGVSKIYSLTSQVEPALIAISQLKAATNN